MNLLLPPEFESRLVEALARAGRREVGGILMGEHLAPYVFRVKDLTVQREAGTAFSFVRLIEQVVEPLRSFFRKTKHQYTRFNYLGEWHSHPLHPLIPSERDSAAMTDIINDEEVGARFAVLLLVKLGLNGHLESSVTLYRPGVEPSRGAVSRENAYPGQK